MNIFKLLAIGFVFLIQPIQNVAVAFPTSSASSSATANNQTPPPICNEAWRAPGTPPTAEEQQCLNSCLVEGQYDEIFQYYLFFCLGNYDEEYCNQTLSLMNVEGCCQQCVPTSSNEGGIFTPEFEMIPKPPAQFL